MTTNNNFRKDSRLVRLDAGDQEPKYMTLAQVSEYTGIHVYTLRKRWDRIAKRNGFSKDRAGRRFLCFYEITYAVGFTKRDK